MASLRKRGTKWQAQIRREGFPALVKTFQLREDAQRWAREQERLIDRGEWVAVRQPRNQTLADLLRRYGSEITVRKRSAASERFHLRIIERHAIAMLQPANLNPAAHCQFRDDRLQQVSTSTVRKELILLLHVLKIARSEWGVPVKTDTLKSIAKPPAGKPRERRLSQDELLALEDALGECRNPLVRHVFLFALATGMRRGEVLSLTWSNVDLSNTTARLPLTKNGEARTVPLGPPALAALPARADEARSDDRIFPLSANALRLAWGRVKRRAGIEDLHFHDLRREAISRFFEMGLSVPEVSLISGHKDVRMLFRYTHLRADELANKLHELANGDGLEGTS
jgi:integrase